MKRMIIIFLALLFPLLPAAAQDEGVFEGSPTDFLPLQVGNQWTYKHRYLNLSYEPEYYQESWWDQNPEIRMLFEIPGYPYDNYELPPDSLRWGERELTIEITHTEMIDGLEYFVFSRADYDRPPLPNLFWAGQKVRLSDKGVLLFRWNGQDVPLYDLNPQHPGRYSIPAYPIREDLVTKLDVRRRYGGGRQSLINFTPHPEINLPDKMDNFSVTVVLPRYGLFCIESYYVLSESIFGLLGFSEAHLFFLNELEPISAIISGEEVSYGQAHRDYFNTHVQSSSWGRLKERFGPGSPFTH